MKIFEYIKDLSMTETQLNELTIKILMDLSNISKEDILYYFSEFTDECEYDYNSSYTHKDKETTIKSSLQNGGMTLTINFTKSITNLNILDKTIQAGNDIQKLKKCLEKVNGLKDEIIFQEGSEDVKITSDKITISLNYVKVIPEIDQIKKGYTNILNSIRPKKKTSYINRNGHTYDVYIDCDDYEIDYRTGEIRNPYDGIFNRRRDY